MTIFPEPDYPTQFRALGFVKGSYLPTEEFKGILTLENGMEINATLGKYLKSRISNRPAWLENAKGVVHCWKVYPRTDPTGKLFNVQLKSSHTVESEHWKVGNRIVARGLIAEEIEAEDNSSSIKVKIHPNPEGRRRNKKP